MKTVTFDFGMQELNKLKDFFVATSKIDSAPGIVYDGDGVKIIVFLLNDDADTSELFEKAKELGVKKISVGGD